MEGYLKELCLQFNIKLTYTNNKYTILSSGINKSGNPVIRVHKKLKDYPKIIDRAILGYYTDFENEDKYIKTIKEYVESQLKLVKYVIKEPNMEYKNYWFQEKDSKSLNEPVELNITSIIKKGFKSNPVELKQNNTIRASKDNLVELDITVDYVKKPLS